MPRANRYFLPGHVWHITHRCQGKFVPIVQVVRRAHHERIYSQSLRFVQDVDKDNIVGISREIGIRDRCRCLVYIDLNMVRAGVVSHPIDWEQSGYHEIQKSPKRYSIIDLPILSELSGSADVRDFQTAHRQWVEQTLESIRTVRDDRWSKAIAVGSLVFVERVKNDLAIRAMHRGVEQKDGAYVLRERNEAYNGDFSGESEPLRLENTVFWNENPAATET